jgi:hypothetical protein
MSDAMQFSTKQVPFAYKKQTPRQTAKSMATELESGSVMGEDTRLKINGVPLKTASSSEHLFALEILNPVCLSCRKKIP